MTPSTRSIAFILVGFLAFHVALDAYWLRTDNTPPYWDEAGYLLQGAQQYDALREQGLVSWYRTFIHLDPTRPSLVSTLTVPFFAALGVSDDAALLVNLIAYLATVLLVYALGASLAERRVGLLAALTLGVYPVLIGLNHILFVEQVMTALVAATLLALWRCQGFRHTGWSLIAGMLAGAGLLTKVFYPVFVVGPWLVAIYLAVQRDEQGRWSLPSPRLRNALLAFLVAALVAAVWYVPNMAAMIRRSLDAAVGGEAAAYGPAHPWQWNNLLNYLVIFIGKVTSAFGFAIFLLALLGVAAMTVSRRVRATAQAPATGRPAAFLLSSIVVSYLVFTSLHNQDHKHIVGVLPALAVLTAWGLTALAPRRLWSGAAIIVGIAALIQGVAGTEPRILQPIGLDKTIRWARGMMLFYPAGPNLTDGKYAYPDPQHWPLDEILTYALETASPQASGREPLRLGVMQDYPGIDEPALHFAVYRLRLPIQVSWTEPANLTDQDVLITKTGDPGFQPRIPTLEAIVDMATRCDMGFRPLPRKFPYPDGSEIVLYARQRQSALLAAPPAPAHPADTEFGAAIRFLGFDAATCGESKGAIVARVTYYWRAVAALAQDYRVFAHLLDPATGSLVAQDDHEPAIPSGQWSRQQDFVEHRFVRIPPGYNGQALRLRVGLYNGAARLPVTSSGQAGATYLDAGSIPLRP